MRKFLVSKAAPRWTLVTLTYTARADGAACRKRPRKVDLELTSLEVARWWSEDGYDTAKDGRGFWSVHLVRMGRVRRVRAVRRMLR